MKKALGILFFVFVSLNMGIAQDIKLDKLEMWYDQGNYRKVRNRSNQLIKNPEYNEKAAPYLWKALSTTALDQKKNRDLFRSLKTSSAYFRSFSEKENAAHYLVAHNNLIFDLPSLNLNIGSVKC